MNAATRLVAFTAGLVVVFGAAAFAGSAIAPAAPSASQGTASQGTVSHGGPGHGGQHGGGHTGTVLSGLAVSDGQYTLRPHEVGFATGETRRLEFQVLDAAGRPVRDGYQVEQEKRLHLIVVRRDMADYQHLHPELAGDGTWSVDLRPALAGVYRAYADFQVGGQKHVLATDLFVPGDFTPEPLPAPATSATTASYAVGLSGQPVAAGEPTTLQFTVTSEGRPVTVLENYLGARGHLVALREGDQAYLHVHPEPGTGNVVAFAATFPTVGRYRLFLQFQTDGQVHTAAVTVEVPQ